MPVSPQRYWLWQPGHRQGQLERLIANVTSSGISWKTTAVFTYFCMLFGSVLCVIEPASGLFLTCFREVAYTLQITYDACHVVHVL